MLTEVRFDNYKALASAIVPLSRLTVLVGANGAGKSTALEGIETVALASRDDEGAARVSRLPGADRLATGGRGDVVLTGRYQQDGAVFEASLLVQASAHRRLTLAHVRASGAPHGQSADLSDAAQTQDLFRKQSSCAHHRNIRRFQLSVPALRAPSLQKESRPRMGDDGAGLGTVLASLLKADRDAFAALEADLTRVVPQVRRVAVESAKTESSSVYGDLAAVDIRDIGRITAPDLSEGTLLTLALLAELHSPQAPGILLLDDIDRGLHPRAQKDLLGCLRRLMEVRPELQIVATSHSPYLLDGLEPEEVVVLALDDRSRAHARSLAEHPDRVRLQGLLGTGEFWASVGEDWVVEEKPDAA